MSEQYNHDLQTKTIDIHEPKIGQPVPLVVNNATSMLQAIGQMAINPEVDIEKVKALMSIQKDLQDKENQDGFNRILASIQAETVTVTKNKRNDQTNSNYSDLAAIVEMVKPIYSQAGMALSFDTEPTDDKTIVRVVCYVTACGYTAIRRYDSPITDKGVRGTTMMTPQHARGSAISYGRRYITCSIFNIATGDDDDGNGGRSVVDIDSENVGNQDHGQSLRTHCPIGKQKTKGKPWGEIEEGFLSWIIDNITDKPELKQRAIEELRSRRVQTDASKDRDLSQKIAAAGGSKKPADFARELVAATNIDQILAIKDEIPQEFEKSLRLLIRAREANLGPK